MRSLYKTGSRSDTRAGATGNAIWEKEMAKGIHAKKPSILQAILRGVDPRKFFHESHKFDGGLTHEQVDY